MSELEFSLGASAKPPAHILGGLQELGSQEHALCEEAVGEGTLASPQAGRSGTSTAQVGKLRSEERGFQHCPTHNGWSQG